MLELRNLRKKFGGIAAVDGLSLEVGQGEIVVLLGPSGSGKSTLLKLVAGLEAMDGGAIFWEGINITQSPVHERGFGLMFQDYALFPHRNVAGNVAFGLEMAALEDSKIKARVGQVLELVGLEAFRDRQISSLSGGEQQRVALARALAPQPQLLMLDEPLGSLDRALRENLQKDLGHILRNSGQTSLYVTHDQEEAYSIADRIVLLNQGRVEQLATPEELYKNPNSAFAARFLGLGNLFEAEIIEQAGKRVVRAEIGEFEIGEDVPLGKANMMLRPDAFRLDGEGPESFTGRVWAKIFRGRFTEIQIDINGQKLKLEISSNQLIPDPGEEIQISFSLEESMRIFTNG